MGRCGHYAFPVGLSPELFSPAQDGSALPASLQLSIERSIKVYLHICQLQWAVWWALIGQAFHWVLQQLGVNISTIIINTIIDNSNNNNKGASVTANHSFLRGVQNWVWISLICLLPLFLLLLLPASSSGDTVLTELTSTQLNLADRCHDIISGCVFWCLKVLSISK